MEWRSRGVEEEGKEGVRREDERTVEKRRGGGGEEERMRGRKR